jgi:hypothetical protein
VDAFRDAQREAELATKTDIGESSHDLALLRRDMRELESRPVIRLGVVVAVSVGVVAALVRVL